METIKQLQDYQNIIKDSFSKTNKPPENIQELIEKLKVNTSDEDLKEFFDGELDFYQQRYEHALKHYLKARNLPLFHFYCYRASAYVSKSLGQNDKAVKFAEKAKALNPEDFFVKDILSFEQYSSSGEQLETLDVAPIEKFMTDENVAFENNEDQNFEIPEEKTEITVQDEPFFAKSYDYDADNFLKTKINDYEQKKIDLVKTYLAQNSSSEKSQSLFFLEKFQKEEVSFDSFGDLLNCEKSIETTSGVFIRWNNKGILINPSGNFLKNFHAQGFHLRDLNYVIVSKDSPECYHDIKEIHRLNALLNKYSSDIQIIHYYLNHQAHQELSRGLKPTYKQEKNTVHLLEIFRDSPEVEKISLNQEIFLHYFPLHKKEAFVSFQERDLMTSSLGLRLELKNSTSSHSVNIGYLSGCMWSPLLAHHIGLCDLLIASFGNTQIEDLEKRKYCEDSLGYYGTYSLLEEIHPKLFCCTEFSARHGDIRLELMQKLRNDFTHSMASSLYNPSILPADEGLTIHLEELMVQCSLTKKWVDPSQIKVIKSDQNLGKFHYLHPCCCL